MRKTSYQLHQESEQSDNSHIFLEEHLRRTASARAAAFSPYCIMSSVTPNAEESTSSAAVVQIVKPKSARTYREVQPQQPPQPLPRRPQTSDGKTKIFTCCANFTSLQETPFGVCIFFLADFTNFMVYLISQPRVDFLTFIQTEQGSKFFEEISLVSTQNNTIGISLFFFQRNLHTKLEIQSQSRTFLIHFMGLSFRNLPSS